MAMTSRLVEVWRKFSRTKQIGLDDVMETQLKRCLSTFDIILLGIGHMVGSGVYVLTSAVARNVAGPAIVLSFIISGIASFLSALCYAEFAGRFPRAGSAYSYTYLALGELWAFVVGWNMILENVIGTAAVSRACSAYIDSLLGGIIRNRTLSSISASVGLNEVSQHVDPFAFVIVMAFMLFLTSGVKVTSYLNNLFSLVNIGVIILIIAVGAYFSDLKNWQLPNKGFMPYGWKGVFAGSATCFYAYVGFDSIATSGEEAKDPVKSIPISTFISMTFATISYVAVSAVLTLMVPYYDITTESGLPDALGVHGAVWAKLIVIVGAVCGMMTVLIGTMYSLTRIVYAMADDGLLFAWMGSVESHTQIPIKAMYFFVSIGSIMALFLDITMLVEMMSIGTLIAYLVVSASIIIIRYQPTEIENKQFTDDSENQELNNMSARSSISDGKQLIDELVVGGSEEPPGLSQRFKSYFSYKLMKSRENPSFVPTCVVFMIVLVFGICLMMPHLTKEISDISGTVMPNTPGLVIIALLIGLLILIFVAIAINHQNVSSLKYKVPFVPLVPTLSIIFNVALMINLQSLTWMRLIVWLTIGFIIYFCYGIKHSKLDPKRVSIKTNNNRNWGSLDDGTCLTDTASNSSTY